MKGGLLLLWCVAIACNCGIAQIVPKTADATVPLLAKSTTSEYSGWPQVRLNVGFTDGKMRPAVDVQSDQIRLLENGVPQKLDRLGKADMPASIIILMDTSSSMKEHWGATQRAVEAFVAASNPEDEFAVLSFDLKVEIVQQFTMDHAKLTKSLRSATPRGASALFDAVALTAELAMPHGKYPLKVVAIFSDGDDNYSHLSLSDLSRRLRYDSAPLVSSAIFGEQRGGNDGLSALASETGGIALRISYPQDPELAGLGLAEDVRSRREVLYTTDHAERDGKLRKSEVKVQLAPGASKVKVRVRQGFYAPEK